MLRSTGTGFSLVKRYDGELARLADAPGDQHYVGDFNGDGKEDLWVFNGSDWSIPYLGMLRSTGDALAMSHRYDGEMPGLADDARATSTTSATSTATARPTSTSSTATNWSIAYLGMLRSTGYALAMTRRYDGNAPGWQMRAHDRHWIADINRRRQGRPVRLQPPGLGARSTSGR